MLNQGESAVLFCLVFLFFAVAGGGAWMHGAHSIALERCKPTLTGAAYSDVCTQCGSQPLDYGARGIEVEP